MSTGDSRDMLAILAGPAPEVFTTRPVIMGTHGMVTSGHYLASRIGLHILEEGGNAVDAGVAMGFALAVLEPYIYGIGGEVPILVYLSDEKRVVSLSGQGPAPQRATIAWFEKNGIDAIPGDGLLAAVVPDAVSTWISALSRFGSMTLSQVLSPSVELAGRGFPMFERLRSALQRSFPQFQEMWPSSAHAYLPGGRIPAVGEIYVQRDLAGFFTRLIDTEYRERRRGRKEALGAARDLFYKGEIAERIVKFVQESRLPDSTGKRNGGLLAKEDLHRYATRVEEPVTVNYRGYDVFKCGPWSQGPVFLQQINMLEGYDLAAMKHNSPEYIHLLIEVAKLAFADRETYYGDPDFAEVPLDVLLSKEYAAMRRKLIDPDNASMELRPGNARAYRPRERQGGSDIHKGDTTHLDAVDQWGNMLSATPSGGWFRSSPVIEGLGFPLGTRLQMFSLDPAHPNCSPAGKASPHDSYPFPGAEGGQAVHGVRHSGRGPAGPVVAPVLPELRGLRHEPAGRGRRPHVPYGPFPVFLPPARRGARGSLPRGPHPHGHDRLPPGKGARGAGGGEWSHGRVLGIQVDADSGTISGAATARMETGYAMGW